MPFVVGIGLPRSELGGRVNDNLCGVGMYSGTSLTHPKANFFNGEGLLSTSLISLTVLIILA